MSPTHTDPSNLCSARRCRAYHGFADEIDTVGRVATLQQGDQIAPRAAADEEDLVGPLQALVKGLLPVEEARVGRFLAAREAAPLFRDRGVEVGVSHQSSCGVVQARGGGLQPSRGAVERSERPLAARRHADEQPSAAPSARGSEPPTRAPSASAMHWAWPMRSLHGSTTRTGWPR